MAVMDFTIENELVKVVASCPRKYDSCTKAVVLDDEEARRLVVGVPRQLGLRQGRFAPQRTLWPRLGVGRRGDGADVVSKGEVVDLGVFPSAQPRFTNATPQVVVVGQRYDSDDGQREPGGQWNFVSGVKRIWGTRSGESPVHLGNSPPGKELGQVTGHVAFDLLHVQGLARFTASDVTPRSEMPQGTMRLKKSRSVFTFSAKPCMVTHRLHFTPNAQIAGRRARFRVDPHAGQPLDAAGLHPVFRTR